MLCFFLDYKDNKINSNLVYIDGIDFNESWSTDDDLINIVLEKIGISQI